MLTQLFVMLSHVEFIPIIVMKQKYVLQIATVFEINIHNPQVLKWENPAPT